MDYRGYGTMLSGNGRYVAFVTQDAGLELPPDLELERDGPFLALHDRTTGTTRLLNVTPSQSASAGFIAPSLSDDGGVAVWVGRIPAGPAGAEVESGIVAWRRATDSLQMIPAARGEQPMVSGKGATWFGRGSVPVTART